MLLNNLAYCRIPPFEFTWEHQSIISGTLLFPLLKED